MYSALLSVSGLAVRKIYFGILVLSVDLGDDAKS